MVLIQLLLPTTASAGTDAMTPLAETRRAMLAKRFHQDTIHVRALPVEMPDERDI